jgi:hypothetical protein
MDDESVSRLVAQVEAAFPGDLVAQRAAWEFIEQVMSAWFDEASEPASSAAAAGSSLLGTARSLLSAAGGQLASAVETLLPVTPALRTLARPEAGQEIEVERATELGLSGPVVIEHGDDFITLLAPVEAGTDPSRVGAVVMQPDGTVLLDRFSLVDDTVATAHFTLAGEGAPTALAIVEFSEPSEDS